jgi:hypothetical protein
MAERIFCLSFGDKPSIFSAFFLATYCSATHFTTTRPTLGSPSGVVRKTTRNAGFGVYSPMKQVGTAMLKPILSSLHSQATFLAFGMRATPLTIIEIANVVVIIFVLLLLSQSQLFAMATVLLLILDAFLLIEEGERIRDRIRNP